MNRGRRFKLACQNTGGQEYSAQGRDAIDALNVVGFGVSMLGSLDKQT